MTAARPLPLAAGLATLAVAWLGPLPELAASQLTAHMLLHLSVVAVAAPLIAIGVGGSRLDPAVRAPLLFAPVPAAFIELVAVWSWHSPVLHDLPRTEPAWLAAEQASFLAAGLLVWLSAFGGDPAVRRARAAAGIGGLLMTSMHMSLLGALLALAPRLLYQACTGLEDQQTGGVLMLLVGGTVYLAGGLWLLAGLLQPERTS